MSEDSSSSKLDNFSKEELIRLIKKYVVLQKQLKSKNEELTNKLSEQSSNETHKTTIDQLNSRNRKLEEENQELKAHIQLLNKQIEDLKIVSNEYDVFKLELTPQLESARREIDLNKSMLDMLNNEIQMLNSEKLQLEKRLYVKRRSQPPPSVIIEEEEEDLEEEERNDQIHHNTYHHNDLACSVHKLNPIEEEEHNQQLNSDLNFINNLTSNQITPNGILILNKQVEDLTFYIDELKSELEAEREKNNEYLNEIKEYRKQIEEFEEQHEFNSNELRLENDRLQKECVDALLRVSEKEKQIADLICSSTATVNTIQKNQEQKHEHLHHGRGRDESNDKIEKFLNLFINEIIDKHNYAYEFSKAEQFTPNELSQINDLISRFKSFDSQSDRIKSYEARMERIIRDFKEEINLLEMKLNEKDTEFTKYVQHTDNRIANLQSELDTEREKLKTKQIRLEHYEKEASKSKVLDLEIADYEKSIKSLNLQLITKDKEINDLKSELNEQSEKITQFKSNIEILEKEKEQSDEKCTKLKQLLVKAKKDVADAKAHEAEHLSHDAQVKAQLEAAYVDIENFKLQIAEINVEKQKVLDRLQANNESHQRNMQSLELKLNQSDEKLAESNEMLASLKIEYENYKLKVQHAFKRQKEQNESSSVTASESQKYLSEIQSLKEVIANLNLRLEEKEERAKVLDKENDLVQEEYAKALDRNTKLLTELKEKENEWKLKNQEIINDTTLKTDETLHLVQSLQEEKEKEATNFKEKLKQLNLQNMQTISLLQAQLEESKQEIDKLSKQITELKNSSIEMQSTPPISAGVYMNGTSSPLSVSIQSMSSSTQSQSTTRQSPSKTNDLLQHQQSNDRSSESTSSKLTKSFEQLLNEPAQATTTSNTFVNPLDSKAILNQIEQLKNELNKAKLQLEHLNELLNESELNNARLTQQINVLKEEIRRLERNQEREKSISNMEYLKNVVLKFLTFTSQQEKAQLLPVLSTMLKLSQEEQHVIMNAKVTTNNGDGWATYLPRWT